MRRRRRGRSARVSLDEGGERVLPLGVRVRHVGMIGGVMGWQGRGAGLLVGASGEHRARTRARHQVRGRRGGGRRRCRRRVRMRYEVRVLRVRGWPVLGPRGRRGRGWSGMGPRVRATTWPATGIPRVQRATVRRAVHQLPYFLLVVGNVVRQLGLLEAGRRHPLVPRRAGRRRVRAVEARLDQGLARLARDHRLQLPRRERVHVAGLARDQQHHLRAGQRRQLVRLQAERSMYLG